MDCKKIQELIVTDYVDGRMENKPQSLIDRHLSQCQACNELLISIKKEAIDPFLSVQKIFPDKFLWSQIKQAIEEEQQQKLEKILKPNFWEKLRAVAHVPRPAFALATFVTMIFIIGNTGQFFINSQFVKINGQDQVEYLSSLIDEPVEVAANNANDPQTPIEKYFL